MGQYSEQTIFPACLAMNRMYTFHLGSGLCLNPKRRSTDRASTTEELFIVIDKNSGPFGKRRKSSLFFEAMNVTSQIFPHSGVKAGSD